MSYITERTQVQSLVFFCIVFVCKTFDLYCVNFPSYSFFNIHEKFKFLKTDFTDQNLVLEVLKVSLNSAKCFAVIWFRSIWLRDILNLSVRSRNRFFIISNKWMWLNFCVILGKENVSQGIRYLEGNFWRVFPSNLFSFGHLRICSLTRYVCVCVCARCLHLFMFFAALLDVYSAACQNVMWASWQILVHVMYYNKTANHTTTYNECNLP